MRGAARLNDKTYGTCYDSSHTTPINVGGKIITASSDATVNNRGMARLGDIVRTDCGHLSKIITASPNTDTNQHAGTARLNDQVGDGPYIARIITASPNTFVN